MINKLDYIPGTVQDEVPNVPYGLDFWQPSWKLINGKIVKEEIKPEEIKSSPIVAESDSGVKMVESFKCNQCDHTSKSEAGMKTHITVKHKKQ